MPEPSRVIGWNEPAFGEKELELVTRVLREEYIGEGDMCRNLANSLRSRLGVKHVVFTPSGSSALFLAVKADQLVRGYPDGYEAIVPDLTFMATANAVDLAKGNPVLADIEQTDYCIDPIDVERKITDLTRIIIPVHFLGRAAPMSRLENLAKEYDLTIIEDVAGALTGKSQGNYLGTFGKMGCFSFQPNKIITCGQGGAVVTNDDTYFEALNQIKNHGRKGGEAAPQLSKGYNFKFDDLRAAVALGQWESIDARRERLITQKKIYESELKGIEGIHLPQTDYLAGEFPMYVDLVVGRNDRNKLSEFLRANGIKPRPGDCWTPLHQQPAYALQGTDADFPVSTEVSERSIWLPNGFKVSEEDIRFVAGKIREFYKR